MCDRCDSKLTDSCTPGGIGHAIAEAFHTKGE